MTQQLLVLWTFNKMRILKITFAMTTSKFSLDIHKESVNPLPLSCKHEWLFAV